MRIAAGPPTASTPSLFRRWAKIRQDHQDRGSSSSPPTARRKRGCDGQAPGRSRDRAQRHRHLARLAGRRHPAAERDGADRAGSRRRAAQQSASQPAKIEKVAKEARGRASARQKRKGQDDASLDSVKRRQTAIQRQVRQEVTRTRRASASASPTGSEATTGLLEAHPQPLRRAARQGPDIADRPEKSRRRRQGQPGRRPVRRRRGDRRRPLPTRSPPRRRTRRRRPSSRSTRPTASPSAFPHSIRSPSMPVRSAAIRRRPTTISRA